MEVKAGGGIEFIRSNLSPLLALTRCVLIMIVVKVLGG